MSTDEFTKLFKYVEKRLDVIEDKIDEKATKQGVDKLSSNVDAYAKKSDDYMQEMLMLAHKVDRLEKWIHTIADKSGVKLEY